MSEVSIENLQEQVRALSAENSSLRAENADRREKGQAVKRELADLKDEYATIAKQRDEFRARAEAGPVELEGKIAELEGTLRARDHRDAFAAVREFVGPDGKKYNLAPKVTTEAVWSQLGYKPEGEKPDGQAIAARYGKALESHPYLFAEVSARPTPGTGQVAGPGGGKPGSSTLNSASGGQRSPRDGMVPGRI